MQKFYENTNISKFIKELISTTEIPIIPIANKNTPFIEDSIYIYNNKIVKGVKTNDVVKPNTISPYVFGNKYSGITGKYTSTLEGYDSITHYYLGQYLRAVKNSYGIDLLGYYNCYNNEYTNQWIQINSGSYTTITDDSYKIVIVPIKFNQTYTIAIDCDSGIEVIPAFYNNGIMIKKTKELNSTITKYTETLFRQPLLYESPVLNNSSVNKNLINYERYLRLLIKVPITNNSSIVVLEGDYTKTNNTRQYNKTTSDLGKVFNFDYIENATQEELSKILVGQIELLQINDTHNYAFSDRLVEYLTLNVISSADEISQNTQRIQKQITSYTFPMRFNFSYLDSIWNNEMRAFIFDLAQRQKIIDINGFVDKDTENKINEQLR